jgi:hypothetical protein
MIGSIPFDRADKDRQLFNRIRYDVDVFDIEVKPDLCLLPLSYTTVRQIRSSGCSIVYRNMIAGASFLAASCTASLLT